MIHARCMCRLLFHDECFERGLDQSQSALNCVLYILGHIKCLSRVVCTRMHVHWLMVVSPFLLEAHDALHHFSCKMLTPRHCTGSCSFKSPLLPPWVTPLRTGHIHSEPRGLLQRLLLQRLLLQGLLQRHREETKSPVETNLNLLVIFQLKMCIYNPQHLRNHFAIRWTLFFLKWDRWYLLFVAKCNEHVCILW